jgi:hypothetical protein
MDIWIVYDSVFGHTKIIAEAIEDGLVADHHKVICQDVHEARNGPTAKHDILIVGSLTRGYLPTPPMRDFVANIGRPPAGTFAYAFDTRLDPAALKASLRWAVNIGGYAAPRLSRQLRDKGYAIGGEEGFVVSGLQGPLRQGEAERARSWAHALPLCDMASSERPSSPSKQERNLRGDSNVHQP